MKQKRAFVSMKHVNGDEIYRKVEKRQFTCTLNECMKHK